MADQDVWDLVDFLKASNVQVLPMSQHFGHSHDHSMMRCALPHAVVGAAGERDGYAHR